MKNNPSSPVSSDGVKSAIRPDGQNGLVGAFAGSFDPPTNGHESMIRRAAGLCSRLVILVAPNSAKRNLLDETTRAQLLEKMTEDLENVEVRISHGLTIEAARDAGANVLIRSLRSASDFEGEAANAWLNEQIEGGMETLFLMGKPEYSLLSSTAVREMLRYNQSIEDLVPRAVFEALQPELTGPKKS